MSTLRYEILMDKLKSDLSIYETKNISEKKYYNEITKRDNKITCDIIINIKKQIDILNMNNINDAVNEK